MSDKKDAKQPYEVLGTHLRYVREQKNETVAEASGAVEIDPEALERIEAGTERPSEDILMLLINHFDVQDQEAVQLWESAGYERSDNRQQRPLQDLTDKAALVVLAMDSRTVYSDGLVIDANASGLVLNFTQGEAAKGQQIPVAKVGMSYDQAQEVIKTLQHAVLYGKQSRRQLPPATS
ncbi:helix-turn-helix transcriptional regulator [Candidatus Saccharibacteria bacterium]|nr:helix-turn-helix transcriptional regulator [Candidatus Saccharibacteria bacterium]